MYMLEFFFFFFQAEDGIRDLTVTGVQTCALPIAVAGIAGGGGWRFGGMGGTWLLGGSATAAVRAAVDVGIAGGVGPRHPEPAAIAERPAGTADDNPEAAPLADLNGLWHVVNLLYRPRRRRRATVSMR